VKGPADSEALPSSPSKKFWFWKKQVMLENCAVMKCPLSFYLGKFHGECYPWSLQWYLQTCLAKKLVCEELSLKAERPALNKHSTKTKCVNRSMWWHLQSLIAGRTIIELL
jgi:hypothetical protein